MGLPANTTAETAGDCQVTFQFYHYTTRNGAAVPRMNRILAGKPCKPCGFPLVPTAKTIKLAPNTVGNRQGRPQPQHSQ